MATPMECARVQPLTFREKRAARVADRSKRAAAKKYILGFALAATCIFTAGTAASGNWPTTFFLSSPASSYHPPSTASHQGSGRGLLSTTPLVNVTRCGGVPCASLKLAEKATFCASDPYPSDLEMAAAGIKVETVGALYEFYCLTYEYPPMYDAAVKCGALTCEALGNGGIILPLIGMLYMFLGLAIVCDEFFVPALEVIVERYEIDDDVAGATFMAAGGSAPELFTALISTFVAPPSAADTGFGTIVGSAVFNVLFVIGACAIFSKGVLELSWWPLFRDATFYVLGLTVLAIFFGTGSYDAKLYPASMEWYECAILLLLYIVYVIMMKYNRWIHLAIVKKFLANKKRRAQKKPAAKVGSTGGTPNNTKVSPRKPPGLVRHHSSRSVLLGELAKRAQDGSQNGARRSSMHFRSGVLQMMVSEKSLLETAGIHLVTKVEGDVKATFLSVAGEKESITRDELKKLLQCMGLEAEVSELEVTSAFGKLDVNGDNSLDWPEFKEWYSSSEAKIWADCDTVFKAIDQDGDGKISRNELLFLLNQILGREPSPEEVDEAWMELLSKASQDELDAEEEDGDEMCIPQKLFNEWFAKSVFFEDRQKAGEQVEKESKFCFPPWPDENCQSKVLYIFSLPLIIPLYCTIPNVTKARFEKFYVVGFVMSIVWIAIFACKFFVFCYFFVYFCN